MNRPITIATRVLFACFVLGFFGLVMPSLLGMIFATLLVFANADHQRRRKHIMIQSFNSTVRAVCRHEGSLGKVALAYSQSSPFSGSYYEYARRLMVGEDPVEAAVAAGVPLQLRTVVAMQSPKPPKSYQDKLEFEDDPMLATVDGDSMPVHGQFIYLIFTAGATCFVVTFFSLFIVPTFATMYEEFGLDARKLHWLFSSLPAFVLLFLLTVFVVVVLPILNRGNLLGIALPRWVPVLPRAVEKRGEILHGLADAIDTGWSMGRALIMSHRISLDSFERRSLERAMLWIGRGVEAPVALARTHWLDAEEAAWLSGASPERTASLLRSIADQSVRDARANLRWAMGVLFPFFVILLGCCVLAYGIGLFSALSELLYAIA